METSGVTETGHTAEFLRQQEGDELIDTLVSEADAEEPARAVEVVEEPEDSEADAVLDSLVDVAPEPTSRATEVTSIPDTPEDVDQSMIDDLLGGEQQDTKQDP